MALTSLPRMGRDEIEGLLILEDAKPRARGWETKRWVMLHALTTMTEVALQQIEYLEAEHAMGRGKKKRTSEGLEELDAVAEIRTGLSDINAKLDPTSGSAS